MTTHRIVSALMLCLAVYLAWRLLHAENEAANGRIVIYVLKSRLESLGYDVDLSALGKFGGVDVTLRKK